MTRNRKRIPLRLPLCSKGEAGGVRDGGDGRGRPPFDQRGDRGGIFAALLLILFLTTSTLPAQTPEAPPAAASVVAPAPEPGLYRGPASCASSNCHGNTRPQQVFDVLQNEYFTWLQRDRHSKAHEVLYGEASQLIARNLGLGAEAHEAPACLACHAFVPPEEEISGDLSADDGISCEACHGPAGGWIGPHTQRGWTTESSVERGMIDLSLPPRRAELCLGCHLGDETRRVDHRLLAAGHPRLVFELDNYGSEMPRHWRQRPPLDDARAWAAGQVAALAEELERIGETAGAGRWPELSLMSCEDCHHPLSEERWRSPREPRPALGLPRWSAAHRAVLRPLVRRFAPEREADLEASLRRVENHVARLGSPPAEAARAARAAAAALDGLAARLEETTWDEATVRTLLDDLAAPDLSIDHAAAEQVALAANSLAATLVRLRPEVLRGGLPEALERLYATVQDPYDFDRDRFAQDLERFSREVRKLP